MTVANGASTGQAIPTDMEGLKDEVLVQKAHRYDYDHSLRNCGIRFVKGFLRIPELDSCAERRIIAVSLSCAVLKIGKRDWW